MAVNTYVRYGFIGPGNVSPTATNLVVGFLVVSIYQLWLLIGDDIPDFHTVSDF